MSQSDEFDLRELLGDPGESDGRMPSINDTPASELSTIDLAPEVEKTHEQLYPTGCPAHCAACCARLDLLTQAEALAKYPGLVTDNHEKLSHPIPEPPVIEPEAMQVSAILSPFIKDEELNIGGELGDTVEETLDQEYFRIFNASAFESKDLEPEQIQIIRHRMMRCIRRVKIALNGIKQTEDGKLLLIEAKRVKAIKQKDAEFHATRKIVSGDVSTKAKSPKKASTGLSASEKQVKIYVGLGMSEEVIRATMTKTNTPIPENLSDIIAKYRK